jgi:hypothetical protein
MNLVRAQSLAFAITVGTFLTLLAPAASQPVSPGREGDLGKLLPPIHNRRICFARTYEPAHLKERPKQKVQAVLFQIRYHRHDPQKEYPEGQRNYYFGMAARVKGYRNTLYASGECVPRQSGIRCGVDCDGGGVGLEHDAKTGLLAVRFEDEQSYLRMTLGCDGEDSVDLKPGADDKIFRLKQASLSACRSLNRKM